MFNDPPNASELLLTVREYIERLVPDLEGQDKYHGLCCTYLLDVVMRELEGVSNQADQNNSALKDLLSNADALPEAAIVSGLCESIRSGKQDENLDKLLVLLIEHVSRKVMVSNPDHLDTKDYHSIEELGYELKD
jgi:hypothetical protein